MWKINNYKVINTDQENITTSEEQIPEVILDTAKNTWWKVFELTHLWWFRGVISMILWEKINPACEIEKLTKYKQADDYNDEEACELRGK